MAGGNNSISSINSEEIKLLYLYKKHLICNSSISISVQMLNSQFITRHFTRGNVLLVMSVLAASFGFLTKNAVALYQNFKDEEKQYLEGQIIVIDDLKKELEIQKFLNDSLKSSSEERRILYKQIFDKKVNDEVLQVDKTIGILRLSLMEDYAKLSRFSLLKLDDETELLFKQQLELFETEKSILNALSTFNLNSPNTTFNNNELENSLLKYIEKINILKEQIKYSLIVSEKTQEKENQETMKFQKDMDSLRLYIILNLISVIFIGFIWYVIFKRAIQEGTFIEK